MYQNIQFGNNSYITYHSLRVEKIYYQWISPKDTPFEHFFQNRRRVSFRNFRFSESFHVS
eukprot:UN02149